MKILKTPADLQRGSITATCIEAFTFFTSDLLLWTELKLYLPEGMLDSVVSSKQLLIHCMCISYLHKWGCHPHWKSSCFSWEVWNLHGMEVPWQFTPINSFKCQIEANMAIVCITLLIVKISRIYLHLNVEFLSQLKCGMDGELGGPWEAGSD